MSKVLIAYASTTGNTEMMADAMAVFLDRLGHDVIIKTFDFDPIYVEELQEYDAVLIGTHTWDDGDLPYEVEDFCEDLELVPVDNQVFGVFGSADSFYSTYGGAIDLMADRLEELGAVVFPKRLKVDLTPTNKDLAASEEFAAKVIQLIEEKNLVDTHQLIKQK